MKDKSLVLTRRGLIIRSWKKDGVRRFVRSRKSEPDLIEIQKGLYEDSLQAVEVRAAELRKWLWRRPEKEIVLVTHGAFLHYLTEDWDNFVESHGECF